MSYDPPLSTRGRRDAEGVWVPFTEDSDPEVIDALRAGRPATFSLWPSRARDSFAENPFFGRANVRIQRVRAWVDGPGLRAAAQAAGGGAIDVRLTHGGTESFRRPDDRPFDLHHEPVVFSYRYDGREPPGAPGAPFRGQEHLGGWAWEGRDAAMIPIGPFAEWTVFLDPRSNPVLSSPEARGRLTSLTLEFWCFSQPFGPGRLGATLADAAAGEGAEVSQLLSGSAAERAGLRTGDVITALDGRAVADAADLQREIDARRPGDRLRLTVEHDGATRALSVTLESQRV